MALPKPPISVGASASPAATACHCRKEVVPVQVATTTRHRPPRQLRQTNLCHLLQSFSASSLCRPQLQRKTSLNMLPVGFSGCRPAGVRRRSTEHRCSSSRTSQTGSLPSKVRGAQARHCCADYITEGPRPGAEMPEAPSNSDPWQPKTSKNAERSATPQVRQDAGSEG